MTASPKPRPSTRSRFHRALSRGERLTQQEAADRLGVSTRRVRDLAHELREEGVPIQETFEDRERVYYLEPMDWTAETVTLDLSERQSLALLIATQAARPTLGPTPLAGSLDEAGAALEEALGPNVVSFVPAFESDRWHFSRAMSVDLDPDVFWALKRAMADQRPVRIDYYSAHRDAWSRRRHVDPLLFAVRKGAWICAAYCHRREAVLDFNLVDIDAVDALEDRHFEPPAGFDRENYFEGRFGALASGDAHTVRLRVEGDKSAYFRRKCYHPTQTIRPAEDGEAIVVTFEVQGLDEIAAFIRSWGAAVRVLDPPALAERIAEEAQAVANQYEG